MPTGGPTQTHDNNTDDTKAVTHISVTAVETQAQLPSTVTDRPPVVNVAAASTVGITGFADARTAFSINEPSPFTTGQLPSTVDNVPLITNVETTSTVGIAGAQMDTSIGTSPHTPAQVVATTSTVGIAGGQMATSIGTSPHTPAQVVATTSTVGIAGAQMATSIGTSPHTPAQVAATVGIADAQMATSIGTPPHPPAQGVATTSTVGIADVQMATSIGTSAHPPAQVALTQAPFHQELKESEFGRLQPFEIQPLQTPMHGIDGVSTDAPLFPLYYKPTSQDWNGMSGMAPGGTKYHFGVQGFDDGFLGHLGSGVHGYNMLTAPAQEAWLSAQNPGGTAGLEMNWDFGPDPSTVETNMPRPTYHLLPMPESNVGQPEELGTRIRKPTGRKEVVPLTEITNSEDDGIPEWMTLAIGYLKEGLGCKDWLDCVDAWAAFEKKIGFQSSTSVSTNCDEFLDCCTHKDLASLACEESPRITL